MLLQPLVRSAVHAMAHVDASSALVLNANELAVNFALDHDCPALARASLQAVHIFDSVGSAFIALVGWLVAQL